MLTTTNYNVSDDDDEYDDSSLPEDEEETSTLLQSRSMKNDIMVITSSTDGNDREDEESILNPTPSEMEEMNTTKKDMFEEIVKIWFPKDKNVYISQIDDGEDTSFSSSLPSLIGRGNRKVASNGERDDVIKRFVDEAYEQCNQFGRAIGDQGMHCLLQNKDYRNGWNDVKRFIEDIFSDTKYDVEFFHAGSTNYWDLFWDGNYDSLSMKKMGYFSLAPSPHAIPWENWKIPHQDTWMRTIANSGFSHVTIIPVEYELMNSNFDNIETIKGDENNLTMWIYDPDYDVKNHIGGANAVTFNPGSITGSSKVVIHFNESSSCPFLRKSGDTYLTRLYRIIVNFVGQPKTPAWWNTKSKWELAERNLRKNIDDLSNIQQRLEGLDIVKSTKQNENSIVNGLDPEHYENEDQHQKIVSPLPLKTTTTTINVSKRKRKSSSTSAPSALLQSPPKKRKTRSGTSTKTEIAKNNDEIESLDTFLEMNVEEREKSRFNSLDDDACFEIFVLYINDIINTHLMHVSNNGDVKMSKIARFLSDYVIPNISDIDFKVSRCHVPTTQKSNEPSVCAFTGVPIVGGSNCCVVRCLLPSTNSTELLPACAFTVEYEKSKTDAVTLIIKAMKYYKQMVELRFDGTNNSSFKNEDFLKHMVYMKKFKRFVKEISQKGQ